MYSLAHCLLRWLIVWLTDWLTDWLIVWLTDWLIVYLTHLAMTVACSACAWGIEWRQACYNGYPECVKVLIEGKADVNKPATGYDDETPLQSACTEGDLKPNPKCLYGRWDLPGACTYCFEYNMFTATAHCVYSHHISCLTFRLESRELRATLEGMGIGLTGWVAGYLECAQLLVDAGAADPGAYSPNCTTPTRRC